MQSFPIAPRPEYLTDHLPEEVVEADVEVEQEGVDRLTRLNIHEEFGINESGFRDLTKLHVVFMAENVVLCSLVAAGPSEAINLPDTRGASKPQILGNKRN